MISVFKDGHRWLSNFWMFETPMQYQGMVFPSVEHFYVAMKSKDSEFRQLAADTPLAADVKALGRTIELREDWEEVKLDVMLYALRYKFSEANPTLRQKLLDTGDQELVESNWWGDTFFGVDIKTGVGHNHLGKLLMQVREEIRNEQS